MSATRYMKITKISGIGLYTAYSIVQWLDALVGTTFRISKSPILKTRFYCHRELLIKCEGVVMKDKYVFSHYAEIYEAFRNKFDRCYTSEQEAFKRAVKKCCLTQN